MRSWTDGGNADHTQGRWARLLAAPPALLWLVGLGLAPAAGCMGARPGVEHPGPQRPGTAVTADALAAPGDQTARGAGRARHGLRSVHPWKFGLFCSSTGIDIWIASP